MAKIVLLRWTSLFALAACLLPAAGALPQPDERFRTEAEKREKLAQVWAGWNTVSRWMVEYETVPSGTNSGSVPVHRIVAAAAPGNLYHFTAHFSQIHPWQADPFSQEYFIHEGSTCHRWPFSRSYAEGSIKRGDMIPGTVWMDILLAIMPRWPITDYKITPAAASVPSIIPAEVLNSTNCHWLARSEVIVGEECAIFDTQGSDRIWIAASKGFCIMRRDIRDPITKRLRQRIVADKITEIRPGLWLATNFRSQFFVQSGDPGAEKVQFESQAHVLQCRLDSDVPESLFTPRYAPGSLKYGNHAEFTQASPGGEDLLDEMVTFMVRYARLPTKPRSYAGPLFFAGGAAAGLAGSALFIPKTRKARPVPQEGMRLQSRIINR